MNRILLLEDEEVIRSALRRLLERHGFEVEEAGAVIEARGLAARRDFDLIIADLRLPDGEGTGIIGYARRAPVLIMTSYASVRSAVESMKLGAADYVVKPFDHGEMLSTVRRLLQHDRLAERNAALQADSSTDCSIKEIVGECAAMQEMFRLIAKVAPTETTVLIRGESGTGKELVARAIHERSGRRSAPLIPVNCASIPEGVIESELFGNEKGAFTGAAARRGGIIEAADGGTLFLDEIGELSVSAQARLLRVLQQGEIRPVGSSVPRQVDIRLLAATHRDLEQMVADGDFRADLYYRLQVVEIDLPPLRERGDDVLRIADFVLANVCKRLNRPPMRVTREAREAIRQYDWPGNVRELENALERAAILAESLYITPGILALDTAREPEVRYRDDPEAAGVSIHDYFRRFVLHNQERMTETELAQRLGVSRKTLWERRQRMGLNRSKRRKP